MSREVVALEVVSLTDQSNVIRRLELTGHPSVDDRIRTGLYNKVDYERYFVRDVFADGAP